MRVLTRYVFPGVRGSGVNQTKAALYIHNGYISVRTVIGKFLLSALAIGSGQSLGPEDPSLQIGAGVASLIGRRVGLSRARLRLFAPVGAAAGLAAAFNAPISAILFVIEEVIGKWTAGVLGLHRSGCSGERRCRAVVLGPTADVSNSLDHAARSARVACVFGAGSHRRLCGAALRKVAGISAAAFAQPAAVAATAAAVDRRIARRVHRILRASLR